MLFSGLSTQNPCPDRCLLVLAAPLSATGATISRCPACAERRAKAAPSSAALPAALIADLRNCLFKAVLSLSPPFSSHLKALESVSTSQQRTAPALLAPSGIWWGW